MSVTGDNFRASAQSGGTKTEAATAASKTELGHDGRIEVSVFESVEDGVRLRGDAWVFNVLEWAKGRDEVVLNRADALWLRDWLNASLSDGDYTYLPKANTL